MLRFRFAVMFVVLVTIAGQRVVAQSPVVYSHYVSHPTVNMVLRNFYTDIPGSEHTLTVPAGTAFISWSLHGVVVPLSGPPNDTARFRPVIGNSFPAAGLPDDTAHAASGSWSVPVQAGDITIKLQVAAPGALDKYDWVFLMDSSDPFSRDAMSWTLVVLPNVANAGVPAVGGLGLGVLVLLLLGLGALVIAHRQKPSPT